MAAFRYRAQSPEGTPVADTMDAASAHEVVQRLQERGYQGIEVERVQAEFARGARGRQLPWADLELLAMQLHSITARNLPLAPGLAALSQGMPKGGLRGVIDQIRIDLDRGTPPHEALANRGAALPPLFARLVRAGEAANAGLPEVLRILVSHSARMVTLQNTLRSALAYPALVLAMTLVVMGVLLWQVLPGYQVISEISEWRGRGTWLNLLSMLSNSPSLYFVAFVLMGLFALYLTYSLRRGYAGSLRIDRLKLAVPRFGRVYYLVVLARFARTLAALLAARVPVVESMELAGAASGSPTLQLAVSEASNRVALGESLAQALRSVGFFEESFCWMLASAEERSAADEALVFLADACERESAARDALNAQLVGPLALVAVGLVLLAVSFQFFNSTTFLGRTISGI